MKSEPLSRGSVATSVLGLGLMLAPASPAFAGITNFSITEATLGSGGLLATVTGTIACPSTETVQISVLIAQFVRNKAVNLIGYSTIGCNPAGQSWTVAASAYAYPGPAIPMKKGPASVLAGAFAYDPTTNTSEQDQFSAMVHFK